MVHMRRSYYSSLRRWWRRKANELIMVSRRPSCFVQFQISPHRWLSGHRHAFFAHRLFLCCRRNPDFMHPNSTNLRKGFPQAQHGEGISWFSSHGWKGNTFAIFVLLPWFRCPALQKTNADIFHKPCLLTILRFFVHAINHKLMLSFFLSSPQVFPEWPEWPSVD